MRFPILLLAAILTACNHAADTGPTSLPQTLELDIDGAIHHMEPDHPREGHFAMAAVANGRLLIGAGDKKDDIHLTVEAVIPGGEPKPGQYQSHVCKSHLGCEPEDGTLSGTTLMPFPGVADPTLYQSYKAPKLGLQPVTVTLDRVERVFWNGAGPAYRIKGTFGGALANLGGDTVRPVVNEPLRKVEGRFDMYAVIR